MRPSLFSALLVGVLVFPLVAFAQQEETPPPTPAAADANYRFGPEDVLQIQVWGHPELSGTVVVSFAGVIQIPSLGDVRAHGRTPAELSEDLTLRYQILEPSVSEVLVSVVEYMNRSVTVLGEVRTPGRYGFRELPDLWGAILAAGGPTPSADLGEVQIVRNDISGGELRVMTLDLSLGIEGADGAALPALRPKDQILVPSTLAATTRGGANIQILGAVNSPGTYRISTARDVVEALSTAGGPTPTADLAKVYLTRATSSGAVSHKLDIRGYLREARPLDNLPLQAGDTVTVFEKTSFWKSFGTVLARLVPFVSLAVTIILASN
ncbi:MAG TPA: polysaccharide biosynthesis/export family protein [Candidatus Krumholzibacteria bacterium]|jgi:polysaccharide export outer membrane protein